MWSAMSLLHNDPVQQGIRVLIDVIHLPLAGAVASHAVPRVHSRDPSAAISGEVLTAAGSDQLRRSASALSEAGEHTGVRTHARRAVVTVQAIDRVDCALLFCQRASHAGCSPPPSAAGRTLALSAAELGAGRATPGLALVRLALGHSRFSIASVAATTGANVGVRSSLYVRRRASDQSRSWRRDRFGLRRTRVATARRPSQRRRAPDPARRLRLFRGHTGQGRTQQSFAAVAL